MQIKDVVTRDAEGFTLHIALDEVFCGVKVTSVSMFISADAEGEDGDVFWGDGDLAVNWDMEGLQNDESADTMGTLLMRNLHSDDEVTKVMSEFYWQHGFDERLREILLAHGFSADAVSDVCTSEWGMQDEERASYDAYALAHEVRAAFGIAVIA